jgi:DNA-binding transcriptional ArsR family regulator
MSDADPTLRLARCLKVLGHPDRLRLLQLARTPSAFPDNLVDPLVVGVCVNDLARAAGLPQSTASRHLGLLHDEELVEITSHGQWRYVRPSDAALGLLATELLQLVEPRPRR